MKTYDEVRSKYQDEINRIKMENSVDIEMLISGQVMDFRETLDNLTDEQRYWFLQGWNKNDDMDAAFKDKQNYNHERLHNIYRAINRELGLEEAGEVT